MNISLEVVATVAGLVLTLINGWLLLIIRGFREEIILLRSQDQGLNEKVSAIQLLIAGQYVTRAEFASAMKSQTETIGSRFDQLTEVLRSAHVERRA